MTTPNTTANISPLPSGDYIFRVAGLNSVGQGDFSTINTAMPVPDPYFGNVSLLMHMDGSSNSFVDSSSYNHTITAVGDATQSSTQSKFGGLSAYFDGSGDYLTADSSSFVFGTGDFTVEAWVYSSDVSSTTQRGWIQTSNQSGGLSTSYTTGIIVHYNNGALRVNVAGTDISTPASLINTNQWYNIAICRQSGLVKIFVNGNLVASGIANGNCSGQYLCVGGYYDTNYLLSGYIDELRITKGIARYASNFTPSPVPFPVSPIITISSQPSDQIASGGSASFSVTASVTLGATLSYQWQKKTGNLPFSDISGATSSSLSLTNLTESNNNELYRCIIRSTGGVSLITNTVTLTTVTPAPFIPSSISGLQLWLDASDSNTLYDDTSGGSLVAADSGVARWEDKSGNARHAMQATSGSRPLRKTAVQGGRDVLRLDGSDDSLSIPSSMETFKFLHSSDHTIFVVFENTNDSYAALVSTSTGSSLSAGALLYAESNTVVNQVYRNVDGSFVIRNASGQNFLPLGFTVLSLVAKPTDGTAANRSAIRKNGGSPVANNSDTAAVNTGNATSDLRIGAADGAGFASGDIAEVIIYDSALSDTDRAAVETYLLTKWGIAPAPVPQTIPGLQLWLDASDAATLYDATSGGSLVAADGAVARWEDKSGNARHATQGTSGSRPLRKTAIQGGKDVLRFDGSNDRLTGINYELNSSYTIFSVIERKAAGAALPIGNSISGEADGAYPGGYWLTNNSLLTRDGAQGAITFTSNSTSGFKLMNVARNGSTSLSLRINGVLNETKTSGIGSVDATQGLVNHVGSRNGDYHNGDIAEIIIYNSALNDTDRQSVETYLINKWGIA